MSALQAYATADEGGTCTNMPVPFDNPTKTLPTAAATRANEVYFIALDGYPVWWPVVLYDNYCELFEAEFGDQITPSVNNRSTDTSALYDAVMSEMNLKMVEFSLLPPGSRVAYVLGIHPKDARQILASMQPVSAASIANMVSVESCIRRPRVMQELIDGRPVVLLSRSDVNTSTAPVRLSPEMQKMLLQRAMKKAYERIHSHKLQLQQQQQKQQEEEELSKKVPFLELFDLTQDDHEQPQKEEKDSNHTYPIASTTNTVLHKAPRVSFTPISHAKPFCSPVMSLPNKDRRHFDHRRQQEEQTAAEEMICDASDTLSECSTIQTSHSARHELRRDNQVRLFKEDEEDDSVLAEVMFQPTTLPPQARMKETRIRSDRMARVCQYLRNIGFKESKQQWYWFDDVDKHNKLDITKLQKRLCQEGYLNNTIDTPFDNDYYICNNWIGEYHISKSEQNRFLSQNHAVSFSNAEILHMLKTVLPLQYCANKQTFQLYQQEFSSADELRWYLRCQGLGPKASQAGLEADKLLALRYWCAEALHPDVICLLQDYNDANESTRSIETEKTIWNPKVLSDKDIKNRVHICSTSRCKKVACVCWTSGKNGQNWYGCKDCTMKEFDFSVLTMEGVTKKKENLIRKYCMEGNVDDLSLSSKKTEAHTQTEKKKRNFLPSATSICSNASTITYSLPRPLSDYPPTLQNLFEEYPPSEFLSTDCSWAYMLRMLRSKYGFYYKPISSLLEMQTGVPHVYLPPSTTWIPVVQVEKDSNGFVESFTSKDGHIFKRSVDWFTEDDLKLWARDWLAWNDNDSSVSTKKRTQSKDKKHIKAKHDGNENSITKKSKKEASDVKSYLSHTKNNKVSDGNSPTGMSMRSYTSEASEIYSLPRPLSDYSQTLQSLFEEHPPSNFLATDCSWVYLLRTLKAKYGFYYRPIPSSLEMQTGIDYVYIPKEITWLQITSASIDDDNNVAAFVTKDDIIYKRHVEWFTEDDLKQWSRVWLGWGNDNSGAPREKRRTSDKRKLKGKQFKEVPISKSRKYTKNDSALSVSPKTSESRSSTRKIEAPQEKRRMQKKRTMDCEIKLPEQRKKQKDMKTLSTDEKSTPHSLQKTFGTVDPLIQDAIKRMELIDPNQSEGPIKPTDAWPKCLSKLEFIGWTVVPHKGKHGLSTSGYFFLIPGLESKNDKRCIEGVHLLEEDGLKEFCRKYHGWDESIESSRFTSPTSSERMNRDRTSSCKKRSSMSAKRVRSISSDISGEDLSECSDKSWSIQDVLENTRAQLQCRNDTVYSDVQTSTVEKLNETLSEWTSSLGCCSNNQVPSSLFVCGNPGVGKTTCVERSLKFLQQANPDKVVFTILNGAQLTGSQNLETYVAEELAKIVKLNTSKSINLNEVETRLSSTSGYFAKRHCILVIDEVDMLVQKNRVSTKAAKLLYTLLRWASDQKLRFSWIGIGNEVKFLHNCLPDLWTANYTNSVPAKIVFPTYTKEQLEKILLDRVGGSDNIVFSSSSIRLIAKRISMNKGDARRAFDLASSAITNCIELMHEKERRAKANGADCNDTSSCQSITCFVQPKHVLNVVKENPKSKSVIETIEVQPLWGKAILCIAVTLKRALFEQGIESKITLGVFESFCKAAMLNNIVNEDLPTEDIYDVLTNLSDAGLIMLGNKDMQQSFDSRSTEIDLSVQLDDVEVALGEMMLRGPCANFFSGMARNVVENVERNGRLIV